MALLFNKPKRRVGLYIRGVCFRNVTDELLPLVQAGDFTYSTRKTVNEANGIFQAGCRVKIVPDGPEGTLAVVTRQGGAWVTVCPPDTTIAQLINFETYRLPADSLTRI